MAAGEKVRKSLNSVLRGRGRDLQDQRPATEEKEEDKIDGPEKEPESEEKAAIEHSEENPGETTNVEDQQGGESSGQPVQATDGRTQPSGNTGPDNQAFMEEIQRAAEGGFECLRTACNLIKDKLPPLQMDEDLDFSSNGVDDYSQRLVPNTEAGVCALRTVGDGNCFYRAASVLAFGHQGNHEEMRLRTVVELATNSGFYLQQKDIGRRIAAQEQVFLQNSGEKDVKIDQNMLKTEFEIDVLDTAKLSTRASDWHLQALGTVLNRQVQSVFPDCGAAVAREYYNALFRPQHFDPNKEPVKIMWTRTGGDITPFIPNHFVPLISVDKITCSSTDDLQDQGPATVKKEEDKRDGPEKEPVEDERRLKITLATNDEGCRITVTNQLLGELVRNPLLEVSAFVPSRTQELIDWAKKFGPKFQLMAAEKKGNIGYFDEQLLDCPPDSLDIDIVIIHSYGLDLGKQAQRIKAIKKCKWVHVVHTDSEELKKFLENEQEARPQSKQKASEHDVQLALCKQADIVIAIGPRLADFYRSVLCSSAKVFDLTPEIIPDLIGVRPVREDGAVFRVFISATYHGKYFRVKGCDIAAKAISLLKDTSYHIIFVVLDTDNAKELQTQVEKEIQLSQFTVKTFSRDPVQWEDLLRAVNLAILPSRAEGFGTSCLRAMSADLPVLVSGNTGLGMALKKLPSKGKRQVVDSEGPQHWANRIREVKEMGAETRAAEAKKLRTEYMEKFNWKKQCGDLVEKMFGMFPNKKDGSEGSASGTRFQETEL